MGYQDTIREHVKEPKTTPISAFRSGSYRDPDYRLPKPDQCDFPPSDELPGARQDPTARYDRGPCASFGKLDHNKTAGIMCPKGMIGAPVVVTVLLSFTQFTHYSRLLQSEKPRIIMRTKFLVRHTRSVSCNL